MPEPGGGRTWLRNKPAAAECLCGFWAWAMSSRRMPAWTFPRQRQTRRLPISQHRRLALLNRFLTDQRIPLRTRVAACLLLLYAQPVARLVRLTIDDVIDHDGQVFIRLGAPRARSPNPLPPWSSHAPSATVP